MFITHDGQDLAFKFQHNTDSTKDIPLGTNCIVTNRAGDFVAQGFARLHPKDQFNKDKGRQVAFGKAIQEFVPKNERLVFWESYSNWKTDDPKRKDKGPRMTLGFKKEKKD